ncbi:MAG: MazG nucleotide pyrophosphohydrolase domain-containing protein [Erysipelotrichaceae bacterium]
MNNQVSVSTLMAMMNQMRLKNDWQSSDTPHALAKSIVIEANELLQEIYQEKPDLENLKGEVADVFMYLLAIVDLYQLDVEAIMKEKIAIVDKRNYV